MIWKMVRDESQDFCGTEVEYQIINVSLLLSVTRPTYMLLNLAKNQLARFEGNCCNFETNIRIDIWNTSTASYRSLWDFLPLAEACDPSPRSLPPTRAAAI